MVNGDSFDRIITYFHAMARVSFEFNGKTFDPYEILYVSPRVFQDYACPPSCGACCMKCSLVWPTDNVALPQDSLEPVGYTITVEGHSVEKTFYVDHQRKHKGAKCQYLYLTHEDCQMVGRCGIYHSRPLPCAFELFKFIHRIDGSRVDARVQLPGRNWALTCVNGVKGGQCELTPFTEAAREEYLRHLNTLAQWMSWFGIRNDALAIIQYLESGPHAEPLIIKR